MKRAEAGPRRRLQTFLPLEKYAGVYNDAWYGRSRSACRTVAWSSLSITPPTMIGDLQQLAIRYVQAHWRDRTIEDAFLTFSLNPDRQHRPAARMAAVSPLADFSFDYRDLLFKPAAQK